MVKQSKTHQIGSPEHLRALDAQRRKKYANIGETLHEGLNQQDGMGERQAQIWNFNTNVNADAWKASANPGFDAAEMVRQVVNEFKVLGTVSARSTRSERRAGKGSHGITDGQVFVEVDLTPVYGVTQTIEVPVQVRNGYLVRPGVFLHAEVPYVFSQTAIDEVLECGKLPDPPTLDRRNMYDVPYKLAELAHRRQAQKKKAAREEAERAQAERERELMLRGETAEPLRLRAELAVPRDDYMATLKAGTQVRMVGEDEETLHLLTDNGIMFRLAREHVDMTLELPRAETE